MVRFQQTGKSERVAQWALFILRTMRARRNARDYERLMSQAKAHIQWAFITPHVPAPDPAAPPNRGGGQPPEPSVAVRSPVHRRRIERQAPPPCRTML